MPYFKDLSGNVHFLDTGVPTSEYLPAGCVPISDAEAMSIANPAPTIDDAKTDKLTELDAAYSVAMQQPVAYMGTTFQADKGSQDLLTSTLVALNAAGSVPAGFGWWDAGNTKVKMTLAELNGLAGAMLNQGWAAFQNKQAKKDAARMAATVADVELVTW